MEIILDTSFILTCIKEKIDFFDAEEFGQLVLPDLVLYELEKLIKGNSKESQQAKLALSIIGRNKDRFKIISLDKKNVDAGIKKYVSGRKVIVATLDRELKRELKGKAGILVIRAKKKMSLE
jgi:rRNA-processing protein FCF1